MKKCKREANPTYLLHVELCSHMIGIKAAKNFCYGRDRQTMKRMCVPLKTNAFYCLPHHRNPDLLTRTLH